MKKRTLYLLLLVFGVGAGIGLFSSWSGLVAKFRARPVVAQEQALVKPLSNDAGAPSKTSVSTPSADQLVEALNAKAEHGLMEKLTHSTAPATWLHIHSVEVLDQDAPNNGVLPNGMAIPNQQVNDTWYHVNGQGAVVASVSIMRTADGKIVQVGVASKGSGWNSATREIDSQGQVSLDQGFSDYNFLNQDLKWLEKSGNIATTTDLSLPNGHAGVEIVIGTTNDVPVQTVNYQKPSVRTEIRAVFDSDTGYLVSREETVWFVDGSQRTFSQLTQEITVEPPTDEVLGYLAQKDREVTK